MKIGILGGSFDPIHYGHLNMARQAYGEYDLDEVWIMPAGHSPNKDESKMTSFGDRFQMVQLAVEPYTYMRASSFEIDFTERSYTCRILERLHERYPEHVYYFIMGADSLDSFDKWYRAESICSLATLLVGMRDEYDVSKLRQKILQIRSLFKADIRIVHCRKYDISSREIRSRIMEGKDCTGFMPEPVTGYIHEHHLYDA